MKFWEYCAEFFGSYYTFFIVIVVNLVIFINGISLAWSSPVLVKLNSSKNNPLGNPITPQQSDIIGSILYIGAALGPLIFLKLSKNLGTKRRIVIASLPGLFGYLTLICANRVEHYYVARFLIGISTGGVASATPSYLAEIIFSVKNRGPYMAINSPSIQAGYLVSYIFGFYFPIFEFNCLIFIFTIFVIVLVGYGCPESPHYVIGSKGRTAAKTVLKILETDDVDKELSQIQEDLNEDILTTFSVIFKSRENFTPFVMMTTLLLIQQFSGIGTLMSYSQQIFLKSKSNVPSEQCSIVVGVIQVISAIAIFFTSKKFSRRSLLTFSLFGCVFCDLSLGIYFYFEDELPQFTWVPLIGLIVYVIVYNSGLDPLPWVYLGEIYPLYIKSVGSALSVSIYWIGLYILSFSFSTIDVSYLFLGYSVCCFFGIFFVKFKLTETKDRTLKQIQADMF